MPLPGPLLGALKVLLQLALTFLGLLLVTFLIGRVVPIDPVLAAVGDRAPARRLRAGQDRARPASAALAAVPDLCRQRRAGRLRRFGAHRPAGARGHPARVPGDPRARHGRDLHRRDPRHPDGGRRGGLAGPLDRPRDPGDRPDRLLGAGVLARPRRPAAVLRARSTGSPGPAASTSTSRIWSSRAPA